MQFMSENHLNNQTYKSPREDKWGGLISAKQKLHRYLSNTRGKAKNKTKFFKSYTYFYTVDLQIFHRK